MTSECDHGEPRGPRYCALCRTTSAQNRAVGETKALNAADQEWKTRARNAINYLAHLGTFTSEDVIARAGLPRGETATNANNAVGALISAEARAGRIRKVGYTQSARPTSHGATITIWERG